jgi:hypothetical protein
MYKWWICLNRLETTIIIVHPINKINLQWIKRISHPYSMEIKDGTATVKEEGAVNYFSNLRSSWTRRIAKLKTKVICFISSITVWEAHFN